MTADSTIAASKHAIPSRAGIAGWRYLLAVAIVLCGGARAMAGGSVDERFLDGLRQRRLFALAEKVCRDRLSRGDLDELSRAELTIELSRTLSEEALEAPAVSRDPLWREALKAVDDFAQKYPQNPRRVQVLVQRGLVERAWGELLRQESEVAGNRGAGLDEARLHLRRAIDELRSVESATGELLRNQPPGRRAAEGELSRDELRWLEKNVRYQLALALRSQAESYPNDSADRASSLTQAVDILGPLSQLDLGDPLAWPSRIEAAMGYRLLGDYPAATRRLELLEAQQPPPRVRQQARAERIRLALATKKIDRALKLLEPQPGDSAADPHLAEVDYAALEAYLAAWQAALDAKDAKQAKEWQTQATDAVRDIENQHGAYWGRRAESLLAQRVTADPHATNVAALGRAAEGFYRAGQLDDALAAYDRAAKQAQAAAQHDQAFDLAYTAATIEQQRQHYSAAAERFRQLALDRPAAPKAAEAHLLAVYNLGQQARDDANAELLKRYLELLDEHLTTWPQAATAARARVWRGRVFEHERRWSQAAEDYAHVSNESDSVGEAIDGYARSQMALLSELRAANRPTQQAASAAAAALEKFIATPASTTRGEAAPSETAAAKSTSNQVRAALATAQILLEFTRDGFAAAEGLLAPLVDNDSPDVAESRAAAEGLLVYAMAAQGRLDEAGRRVDQLTASEPQSLVALIERLDRLSDSAQSEARKNLALLVLRLVALVDPAPGAASAATDATAVETPTTPSKAVAAINDEQRLALALARGRALAAAGRVDEAASTLKKIAEAHPRDGHIQELYAGVLADSGHADALAAWSNIERKSRSGSERWLRAKYQQALVYERRGEKQHAAQVARLIQSLYPELGGPELKEKYRQLLERCQAKQ